MVETEWHFGLYVLWVSKGLVYVYAGGQGGRLRRFSRVVNSRERVAFGLHVFKCIWSGLEFGQAGLLWVAYMFVWVVGLAGLGQTQSGILKGLSRFAVVCLWVLWQCGNIR